MGEDEGSFKVEWLGVSSYKVGLTHKRPTLATSDLLWLRQVTAREMGQGLGRLGFAAILLDWERPFLGPLYAWSSAIQGKSGPMKIPAMIKVLFCWLADRLETGDRLQRPCRPLPGDEELVFFIDAKAENGRAWIGGF